MNLRLGDNSLLFKITEEELLTLIGGTPLEQSLSVPGGPISVRIEPGGDRERLDPVIDRGEGLRIRLPVSHALLNMLRSLGRNRDGLQHQSGDTLVALQVDVRSQKVPMA